MIVPQMARSTPQGTKAAAPRQGSPSNGWLFRSADYLSRPAGFYVLVASMVGTTALLPLGLTDFVTYILSVAAILISGVVLLQGYRDTAAVHAKLDEMIIAMRHTRNEVVGLEHAGTSVIRKQLKQLEDEARKDGRDRDKQTFNMETSSRDDGSSDLEPSAPRRRSGGLKS